VLENLYAQKRNSFKSSEVLILLGIWRIDGSTQSTIFEDSTEEGITNLNDGTDTGNKLSTRHSEQTAQDSESRRSWKTFKQSNEALFTGWEVREENPSVRPAPLDQTQSNG